MLRNNLKAPYYTINTTIFRDLEILFVHLSLRQKKVKKIAHIRQLDNWTARMCYVHSRPRRIDCPIFVICFLLLHYMLSLPLVRVN